MSRITRILLTRIFFGALLPRYMRFTCSNENLRVFAIFGSEKSTETPDYSNTEIPVETNEAFESNSYILYQT
jgi:hypothetical protein